VQPEKDELMNVLRTLNTKLDDLRTCNDLMSKHGAALQRALVDIEQTDNASDMSARIKPINERATLFRITSTAMLNVCIFH
jgi:oxysterol-binding protein 1